MEAETNRALVAAADRLVVLADHTKWGTVGISSIVALAAADVLITDDGCPRPPAGARRTGGRADRHERPVSDARDDAA